MGHRRDLATGFLDLLPQTVGDPTPPNVDDQDDDQAEHGAQPQPRVDRGDHGRGPEQEKGDAGGVGQRPQDPRSLIDVGLGHGEQVPDRLTVEPGHLELELMCQQLVADILSGPKLEVSGRGPAQDDSGGLEDGDPEDHRRGGQDQALRVHSLIEHGDDQSVGHPPDRPRRGDDGAGEHGCAENGEAECRRMPFDEAPDEPASVAQHRPGGHMLGVHEMRDT